MSFVFLPSGRMTWIFTINVHYNQRIDIRVKLWTAVRLEAGVETTMSETGRLLLPRPNRKLIKFFLLRRIQ